MMLSPELADLAHSLAVWCQVRVRAEQNPILQAEYGIWAEWLENSAVAVRLEIEFVRSLSDLDGRIPDDDQALLETFSRFTMQSIRRAH